MMLRKHDRYVLWIYLGTFLAVLCFFTLIVVVIDLADGMTKFSRQWESVKARGYEPSSLLVKYYLTLIPFIWMKILPFAVSIAAAFSLTRLARHNELVALAVTGVSFRRIVLPILGAGCVMAVLMVVAQHGAVSALSRQHAWLQRILEKRSPERVTKVPHFRDPGGARLAIDAFLPLSKEMESAWVSTYEAGQLVEIHWYPELAWDAEKKQWLATRGGEALPNDGPDTGVRRFPMAPGTAAPLTASLDLLEVALTVSSGMGLSFDEARALADAHPQDARLQLGWHQLAITPISTVVLLLLVLPFCLRIGRRTTSSLPAMTAALGMGGLFFGATYLCNGLATSGDLNPVVMAWLPTVVFGSLGLALFATLDG